MSQRIRRMADQVQRELAELIRQEIKDPRLGGMITISAVKVSKDMGYGDIYVTVLGREFNQDDNTAAAHKETIDLLNGAAGFLRQELGRRLSTRVIPRLRFHYDMVTSHGNYMATLISKAVADLPPRDDDVT